MEKQYKKLMLEQMDDTFKRFKKLGEINRPTRGWIRAIRQTIGMSGPQLASRLGISPPGVYSMEESEANYKITLKTLNKAAEALDCTVVYALLPNNSLKKMVDAQARRSAEALVMPVAHTMKLEKQLPRPSALVRDIERMTQELIDNLPIWLWNE